MRPNWKSGKELFKVIARDTWQHMAEAKLLSVAGNLAYTTLLSIIPALAVSFAIFQAFGGMEKLYATIEPLILQNLTEGASEEAIQAIRNYIGNIHGGALGAGGLIGLILTTMSMLASAERAINDVWRAPLQRKLFNRVASYWLFITLGPVALAFAVGAVTSSNIPLTKLLPSGTGIFLITVALFYVIYKWVPNRPVSWRAALAGSAITAIFWNLARLAYALYNEKVVTYNKIYGSLGAIPVLLVWIYIVWLIVLGGASLTASLQKRLELK